MLAVTPAATLPPPSRSHATCAWCHRDFVTIEALIDHAADHAPGAITPCGFCKSGVHTRRTPAGDVSVPCPYCNATGVMT